MAFSKYKIIIAFIAKSCILAAQNQTKEVTNQPLVWYGYFNTAEIFPNWFLTTEIQERHFINPDRQHQFLTRGHLHYKLGSGWDVGEGFTYFLQSPQDPGSKSTLVIPELRPHIEFNNKHNIHNLVISHRYKVEVRFFRNTFNGELASGFYSYSRLRYRIGLEYVLFKSKTEQTVKLKISDEIHINAGKNIILNRFDQNRIYIGLSYSPLKNINLEAGYLNWYQQRTSGYQYYKRDIIRITLSHKISLIKSK